MRRLYSAVVGAERAFVDQAQQLVWSLTDLAGVPHSQIVLHAVGDDDRSIPRELRDLGVRLIRVDPFPGHAYCNKLQQLTWLARQPVDDVVLLDTDVIVLEEPPAVHGDAQGKAVDFGNPPIAVLERVFQEGNQDMRPWAADVSGEATAWGNVNGGVYVLSRSAVRRLAVSWPTWATWCLERQDLFSTHAMHIDQVSFCLAVASESLDFTPLDRRFNVPTHIAQGPHLDCEPALLHYHRAHSVTRELLPVPGLDRVNRAIDRVNRAWSAHRRDPAPRDSSAASSLRDEGRQLLGAGEWVEALERFTRALESDPADLQAVLGAERASARLGDHAGALEWCQRAAELSPEDPDVARRTGENLRELGRLNEALSHLGLAVEKSPEHVGLWIQLGRCHQAAGHDLTASECFRHAVTLDPSSVPALTGAAWAASGQGDHESALAWFRRAESVDVANPVLPARIAQQLRLLDHHDDAGRALAAALERFPGNATILMTRATWREEDGDVPGAMADLEAALGSSPDDEAALVRLNRLRLAVGDERSVVAHSAAFLARNRSERVVHQRAQAHLVVGDWQGCREDIDLIDRMTASGAALAAELQSEIDLGMWEPAEAARALSLACDIEPMSRRWDRLSKIQLACVDPQAAAESRRNWAELERARPRRRASDRGIRGGQGLIGNIINEYLLDPDGTAAAQWAFTADDVAAAGQAVRDHPSSLACASTLLLLLRRCGALEPRPSAMGGSAIPRTIVQAWFGGPTPADVARASRGWGEMHPGWEHRVFDDASALRFFDEHGMTETADAFRAARHPAARADIFRLAYLEAMGGVWVDIDDVPEAPLDSATEGRSLLLWQEDRGNAGNNLLGAAPGHPVIAAALREASGNCLDSYGESTWLATGPGLVTRALATWMVGSGQATALAPDTSILDRVALRRHLIRNLPLRYRTTARFWQRFD